MDEAKEVLAQLARMGKTVATAESCTGGLLGCQLTAIPGSSAVYVGGAITYCNELKRRLLGVDGGILERCGAVCAPVAIQMAQGIRALTSADFGISVTGVAGPGADVLGNPEGLVYIAAAGEKGTEVRELHLSGSREMIRTQAARQALELLLTKLKR